MNHLKEISVIQMCIDLRSEVFGEGTVFKEAADLRKTVRWELLKVSVMFVLWVISTHRNYLVIFLSLY